MADGDEFREILDRLGLGLYALTFEEYELTGLDQLPSTHDARDALFVELGLTPNDRFRLHEVVRDRAQLERFARLRAEPDPFELAAVRRQRAANERQRTAFDASLAVERARAPPAGCAERASSAAAAAAAFERLSAIHLADELCATPVRVVEPSAFASVEADALFSAAMLERLRTEAVAVIDGAVDAQTVEDARREVGRGALDLQPTVQGAARIRGDEICWIDVHDGSHRLGAPNAALARCAQRLAGVVASLNGRLAASGGGGASDVPHRLMLARYGHGAAYEPHYDNPAADPRVRAPDQRLLREWSLVLYLNAPGWSAERHGGLLRCRTRADEWLTVVPQGGRLVVFASEHVLHEVLPVLEPGAERLALTLWSVRRADARALAPPPPLPPPPAPRVLVVFASVGIPLDACAGASSVAIENGDYLSLLCSHATASAVACAHVAIPPRAALDAQRRAAPAAGPAAEAELRAAGAYATGVGARLERAPAVDWRAVAGAESIRARAACALGARGACAAPPAALLLVLDGYDLLHGFTPAALAEAALEALSAAGVSLPAADGARAVRTVARAMCETSAVDADGARRLDQADRVWVPAASSAAALARSGVDPARIRTLPQLSVPASPAGGPRAPGAGRVTFLCVFVGVEGWHFSRKGVDVLLRAFAAALCPPARAAPACAADAASPTAPASADARLLLKVGGARDAAAIQAYVDAAGLGPALAGRLELQAGWLAPAELGALVLGCDVFVLPSRGEGWCRPLAEALAAGKAVVGVRGSGGPDDFLDETVGWTVRSTPAAVAWHPSADAARTVRADELGTWAEPDEAHLAETLRRLYAAHVGDVPADAEAVATRARAAVERMRARYSAEPIRARLLQLVAEATES
jgi:glycosyltransferase involved in cell wall biosynthesis